MARKFLLQLALVLFACVLCLGGTSVSAKALPSLVNLEIRTVDCTHLPTIHSACRSLEMNYSIQPRSNETSTAAATSTSTGANDSSFSAMTAVIVVCALVFVGFLVYFAWQCVGCLRGPRSGKSVFGYVGV